MPNKQRIIGYDGPGSGHVVVDGRLLPMSDPRALVALTDAALLTGLGHSEKAAEYQQLVQARREPATAALSR